MLLILNIVCFHLVFIAAEESSTVDGLSTLIHAFGSGDSCCACTMCRNSTHPCSERNCCERCFEPAPSECPFFPVKAISKTSVVTPTCFEEAEDQIRELLKYLDYCSRGTKCSQQCRVLKSMQDYAKLYSQLFGRNQCRFQSFKDSCARPILRVNEAMLSILENMARVVRPFEHTMRMAGCFPCACASDIMEKTLEVYTKVMGTVLYKVTQYLTSKPVIPVNDPVLSQADDIAIIAIQLSAASADLLTSRGNCSTNDYCDAITFYKDNLETLDGIADNFESVEQADLNAALVVVGHYMLGLTFEVKLNASAQSMRTGPLKLDQIDKAREVAKMYRETDYKLRHMMDELNGQPIRICNGLTKVTQLDAQLFQRTTALMTRDSPTRQLVWDLQSMMHMQIIALAKEDIATPSKFEQRIELFMWLAHYVNNLLDMLHFENPDEIADYSGLRNVEESLLGRGRIGAILNQILYVKALVSITKIPAYKEKCMPRGHFATYRPILREMTSAASSMFEFLWESRIDYIRLKTISKNSCRLIETSWNFLYLEEMRSCGNHDRFALQYVKLVFEILQKFFSKPNISTRAQFLTRYNRLNRLIIGEWELMVVLMIAPRPLNPADIYIIKGLHEKLKRMLENPAEHKASLQKELQSIKAEQILTNSDLHKELGKMLRAIIDVTSLDFL